MAKVKKRNPKKGWIILGIVILALVVLNCIFLLISVIGNSANTKMANSFAKIEKEDLIEPKKDKDGNWTFTTDRDFKIMQLTDIHLGGGFMSLKKDSWALNAVASMIMAEKPDLVVVTGDIAYPVPFQAGTFNNLASAKIFAALMEKLGVYWTFTFGNHDTEAYSYYSREDIVNYYKEQDFKYCLFQRGPEDVDGEGNQIIHIKNKLGLIKQTLYMFDSHSYTNGDWLGVRWQYDNIHNNQIEWYKNSVLKFNEYNKNLLDELDTGIEREKFENIKSMAFFHIPLEEYLIGWNEFIDNGSKDTENVKYYFGSAGEEKKIVYCGINSDELFETMQELGSTKAIFCGHDHLNNFSIDYKGIRLTYGYSIDYLAYYGIYKKRAQRGCTMITVKNDGNFEIKQENYYQEKYKSQYEKEDFR